MLNMENDTFAQISKVNLSYTWKIKQEELIRHSVGERIRHDFSVDCFDWKWRLELFPKGIDMSNENYTGLFIYLVCSRKVPVTAKISFYLLNSEGTKYNEHILNCSFTRLPSFRDVFQFILFNDLLNENFLVNNIVTIVCNIAAQTTQLPVSEALKIDTSENYGLSLKTLSQDFQKVMKNTNLSDITLTVSGKKLSAHKIILSARSPVFAALFNIDMIENIQSEINIDDVELDVFKEMLRFIYTGKVKNLQKLAYELFAVSDKYELGDLKNISGLALFENLTIDNAIDVFVLLDRHSAVELRKDALNFIISNIKSIVNTERFKTFEKTHPCLTIEILRSAVTR